MTAQRWLATALGITMAVCAGVGVCMPSAAAQEAQPAPAKDADPAALPGGGKLFIPIMMVRELRDGDVHVDEEVRLKRVWCAVDAGLVISPDGVRNQVEGGIIQAASWTLKEQVTFADGRVASDSWETYPILKFSEVPEIEIALMDRPDDGPLGVGEVAQGPMAAAIANAVADALGLRIRDLPLTRERLVAVASG